MSCEKYPTGYPITAVVAARRLRAAGETLTEIRDFIHEQYGTRPTANTVSAWTNSRAAKTVRAHNRRRQQRRAANGGTTGARLGRKEHTSEFRLARMRALREQGLDDAAIAAVMSFDYGDRVTAAQVTLDLRRGWKTAARAMLAADPSLTAVAVARVLHVSDSSVVKFRKEEGL